MERVALGSKSACCLAACLLAGALASAPAVAAERHIAPWFSPGGLRTIPLGRGEATVMRGAFHEAPFIRHVYRGFLGREPSPEEVRGWGRELGTETGPTGLVRAFMDSDEFFIRQAYLGLLRREPDPYGMDAFANLLRTGGSRADVVESILRSEEFRRLAPDAQGPPGPPPGAPLPPGGGFQPHPPR